MRVCGDGVACRSQLDVHGTACHYVFAGFQSAANLHPFAVRFTQLYFALRVTVGVLSDIDKVKSLDRKSVV